MSIFSSILNKLGFGDKATAAPAIEPPAPAAAPDADNSQQVADMAPPASVAISVVDVVSQLEGLASAHAEKLNWKVSIVDLMKLLGLDSSLTARKALAVELDCPTDKMGDSALMNLWLHKTVLQKLADNGGNVPTELLG